MLLPPFARVALGGGALELGWLMSAQAVGRVLGGLVIGSAAARLSPRLLLGAVFFGLIDLANFLYPAFVEGIALGLALFVLVGVPATGRAAGLQALLQTSAEDRYRGRGLTGTAASPSTHGDRPEAGHDNNTGARVPTLHDRTELRDPLREEITNLR